VAQRLGRGVQSLGRLGLVKRLVLRDGIGGFLGRRAGRRIRRFLESFEEAEHGPQWWMVRALSALRPAPGIGESTGGRESAEGAYFIRRRLWTVASLWRQGSRLW
jgi:hypothetical protein